jgi:uncharacterized protein involved in type VI secretion and phage assembly
MRDQAAETVLADLVRWIEHRFYGKYRGTVVDNADPEKRGRLRVKVPSVLGDEVVTGWAMPCVPYGGAAGQGLFAIPEVEAGVWIEFEEGDLEFPIWVGTFWSKPGGEAEPPRPNGSDGAEEGDVQDPPTCKIWKTLKGHTIQLEDKDGAEKILIADGANGHLVRLDADGIALQDATGNLFEMKGDAFNIVAKVALTIDASGQALVIKASSIDLEKA